MSSPTGFRDVERKDRSYLPVEERRRNYREFVIPLTDDSVARQGLRCIDCGIPYCHTGCPVNNLIPDWNELVADGDWQEAVDVLHSTNNFPEFTGRICPAPCEEACTLNLHDAPVTIKTIEYSIIEKAWKNRWIVPEIPRRRTDKSVAIIGSGPAGLAAAQQLARAGHSVDVFEKSSRIGGLLRYGIPDFKLDKSTIDRRMAQMQSEGVERILEFDAVVLATGAEHPRNLDVAGRDLDGVHFAMEFLYQQNQRIGRETLTERPITAEGKHVIVIGGGDTGSDCVGTSIRQGAASVTQLELLPKPPDRPDKMLVWPNWPTKLRTSSSHEEGCERLWSVNTKAFEGGERVERLRAVELDWTQTNGRWEMTERPDSEFTLQADLVLLAMGFLSPVRDGLLEQLGVELDQRGNVKAALGHHQTSIPNVFAAGDSRRGQSLVVWAIHEGRQAARAVDEFLMGATSLPG